MNDANELDWKTYESITRYIYETLGRQASVKIIGHGNTCIAVGKSGVSHQIDVLTTHSDGIHTYRTAIECKYWKEKVNKEIVMKLSEIIEDTGIDKGVIVSKNGFTWDAIAYAEYRNIGLVELRQIQERDLNKVPAEMDLGYSEIRTSTSIVRSVILKIDIGNNQEIDTKSEFGYLDFIILYNQKTEIPLIKYVTDFRVEITRQYDESEVLTKHYEIPNGVLINRQSNTSVKINGITFTGQRRRVDASQSLKVNLVDQVWLLMNSIFEKRTFTVLENGLIIEHGA